MMNRRPRKEQAQKMKEIAEMISTSDKSLDEIKAFFGKIKLVNWQKNNVDNV